MNFQEYQQQFVAILTDAAPAAPYDNPAYLDYTKLNWSRMNRWLKQGVLSDELKTVVSSISTPRHWIIITEPWCGDAAHIVPFLHMAAELNPLITVEYQLRDTEPFLINDYLTNGGKAIPKLIIRDEAGLDLANWGPRPAACQILYHRLTAEKADFETVKSELQKWYNNDKGRLIQEELVALIAP
ncbi:MAG TPA: thioredoxin family protein [Pedobacter sp.]|nr:thioredoxin family protein [Pedobacter sp.]